MNSGGTPPKLNVSNPLNEECSLSKPSRRETHGTFSGGVPIAIASSGLGHIRRGIETWAEDLAAELQARGTRVTLFQGAGTPAESWKVALSCRRRFDAETQRLVRFFQKLGGWRYGMGSGYEIEQTTFAWNLWKRVRRDYSVLHVQDPWLAFVMDRLHRIGRSRPQVILAHGTEEPPAFLRRLSNLQHLAPCYLEEWEAHRPPGQRVYAIPNFVDVERFHPGDRTRERARWNIPPNTVAVLCTAAIKRHHKRIDQLLLEFDRFRREVSRPALLIVAGAREAETDEVKRLGQELLGDQVRFLESIPRTDMPSLMRAADLFALASLHEMMPIAVLEALASGLPVVANNTPTLAWMVGPAGRLPDLSQPGTLAETLRALVEGDELPQLREAARRHAVAHFSPTAVVAQITDMYQDVLDARNARGRLA